MLKSLKEIEKINFDEIKSEKEFKEVLQMTNEEFDELLSKGRDSTDENTPKGLKDVRIHLNVVDEEGEEYILPLDLVYEVETKTYADGYEEHEYKNITNIIVYDLI